jgi:hypothetical protein
MGLFLVLFGMIIRRYRMVEMLSGYDSKKVLDRDGLANWTGVNLILMGALAILIGILAYVCPISNGIPYIIGLIIVFFLISIRTAIGCRKYEVK